MNRDGRRVPSHQITTFKSRTSERRASPPDTVENPHFWTPENGSRHRDKVDAPCAVGYCAATRTRARDPSPCLESVPHSRRLGGSSLNAYGLRISATRSTS